MKTTQTSLLMAGLLMILTGFSGMAQNKVWKLEDCINYALENNLDINKQLFFL